MTAALKEARRAKFWALEPGDVIPWTSARNNYATKLFRIDGVADKANLDVVADLTEVDPTDYDPAIAYQAPVFSSLGPIRPPAQEFTGWAVEQYTFTDADGTDRRPDILVKADGDLDDVEFVRVQVCVGHRLLGDGAHYEARARVRRRGLSEKQEVLFLCRHGLRPVDV
jgi:hypothetical protein